MRVFSALLVAGVLLSACTATTQTSQQLGTDGKPLPKVYRIRGGDAGKLQFRMLDSVNALRQASGVAPVQLNPQLNAAARDAFARHVPAKPPLALWLGWIFAARSGFPCWLCRADDR